jgi:hypothetical protein
VIEEEFLAWHWLRGAKDRVGEEEEKRGGIEACDHWVPLILLLVQLYS